jgi:hypothetical protein
MTPKTQYTATQAVQIAQAFDVIAAHQNNLLGQYIPQMKAANPNLVILVYLDGSFVPSSLASFYPASWYAHDAKGNKLTSTGFGNYLMDVGNPNWATTVAQNCQKRLAPYPYDGCFIDMLGEALLLNAGYLSSVPINPATGLPWTTKERMDATTKIAQAVVSATPGKQMMANGLKAGYTYFATTAPTSELFNAAPSGLAETWLRQATHPVSTFETEAVWLQDINMLADATTRGRAIAVTTKVWITATANQIAQWHKYALASFLMGTQGTAYFAFLAPKTAAAITTNYAWDHVNIGSPTGSYSKVQQVYQRLYTNGITLVNVSPTQTYTVTLPRSCTTLEGTVVTSITMAPESGEVCL